MNLSKRFQSLPGFTAGLTLACLLVGNPALAQSYQVKNLSGNGLFANALNAHGQVAGEASHSNGTYQAYVSYANGDGVLGITNFSTTAAGYSVNSSGQIAGRTTLSISPYRTQAFVTGPDGQNGTLLSGLGGQFSYATSINDSGTVAGVARNAANKSRAVQWAAGSTEAIDLGTLGGTSSWAASINSNGVIAGYAGVSTGSTHAAVWAAGTHNITDLGTLAGLNSYALAVNDSNQVVGYSELSDGNYRAFISTTSGQGMRDLGSLGWIHSQASFINNKGVVAGNLFNGTDGTSYLAGHAFITGTNGESMVDLNDLVSLGEGLHINDVWGLNDSGQLLVSDQNGWSYLLTPVPEAATWSMLLAGLLVLTLMERRRRQAP